MVCSECPSEGRAHKLTMLGALSDRAVSGHAGLRECAEDDLEYLCYLGP